MKCFLFKGPSAAPYPQAAAPMAGGQFDAGARFIKEISKGTLEDS